MQVSGQVPVSDSDARPRILASAIPNAKVAGRTGKVVKLSRGMSAFLLLFGIWTWILWPNFLKNIWQDDRSWNDGPTGFFLVHLALTVVSFAAGNAIGWLGLRGLRAARRQTAPTAEEEPVAPRA
jgi:hypothetical protein